MAIVTLDSERDESVSDDNWNIVSNADRSLVNVDRCT